MAHAAGPHPVHRRPGRHAGTRGGDPRRHRLRSWSGWWNTRRSTPPAPPPVRSELTDPRRFPTFDAGRGGQWTYHGPGQRTAYVMLDLSRPHGMVPARDVRCFVHGLEEWLIRALDRFGVRGERRDGPDRHLGRRPATGTRGEDRRDRRAGDALGQLARRGAERCSGPRPLRRHRALRHQRLRRHQPACPRHSGHHGQRRCDARRCVRGGGTRFRLTHLRLASMRRRQRHCRNHE